MDVLTFENNGRTLTCRSESSPATPGTNWWWIDVSGESERYAAFRTEPSDTPENVQQRIVACYEQMLIDRARPRQVQKHWSRRSAAPKAAEDASPEGAK